MSLCASPRFLASILILAGAAVCGGQVISTIAGFGADVLPGDGGPALMAGINEPEGIVVDGSGNVYFYDTQNNRVRQVNTAGIDTVAGNGSIGVSFLGNLGNGGPAVNAALGGGGTFSGLAMDAAGNLYISDAPTGWFAGWTPRELSRFSRAAAGLAAEAMADRRPARASANRRALR